MFLIISNIILVTLNGKISQSRFFSKNTIYLDFKAQRSALYRWHGNVILEENVMWEIYNGYLIPLPNFVLI